MISSSTVEPTAIHTPCPKPGRCRRLGWIDRKCRDLLFTRLSTMHNGCVAVTDHDGTHLLGEGNNGDLMANITVLSPSLYRRVLVSGSLGAADSFVEGEWTTPDLVAVLRFFARNIDHLAESEQGLATLGKLATSMIAKLRRNTRRGSKRNIAEHYDLGNTFFELFLDSSMMYSSAIFDSPTTTLEDASRTKLNRVGDSLELQASDHVLEIGTGWGGFATHAASRYGCHVTTTTISDEQFQYARQRVVNAKLDDSVTVIKQDYRDLTGQFDKLVSIEMLEAVGHEFLDTFFGQCNRLCKHGGRVFVQTIVMPEQRSRSYRKSIDFIQKYVFPGGFLPSLTEIQESVGRATNLRLLSVNDHSSSYARTLREWRSRFMNRIDDVRQLGFSEDFIRTWNYYFSYCEAAFLERAIGILQLEWVKVGEARS